MGNLDDRARTNSSRQAVTKRLRAFYDEIKAAVTGDNEAVLERAVARARREKREPSLG
jgi:hypothetical protein